MLKRIYWSVKVALFPHLERRTKPRPKPLGKMSAADDLLAAAIIDFTHALEKRDNKNDPR